jgi:Asp/Glu/hydantoin racemase
MARYRAELERRLAVPVIDPTQAAANMALALLRLKRVEATTSVAAPT